MAGLLAMAFCLLAARALALQSGDVLTNKAYLHYHGLTGAIESTVDVTIGSGSGTRSTLALLAPDSGGTDYAIAASRCRTPADVLPSAQTVAGYAPLRLPGTPRLGAVDAYAIGDPVLVSVTDQGQNLSPTARDTIQATVSAAGTGDTEQVTLTETGANTGEFIGYVYSTSRQTAANDCALSVRVNSQVTATYVDPKNPADVSQQVADVAPIGEVFDDVTGNPISGVVLTIENVDRNSPASVRGDGPLFIVFPSSLKTGTMTHDASGATYAVAAGQYRFPAIPEGDYRIQVFHGPAYAMSTKSDAQLQALAGGTTVALSNASRGPRALSAASRGQVFHINQGALPRIDIALHPMARQGGGPETKSSIEFLQYSDKPGVGTPYDVQQSACVGGYPNTISELRNTLVPVPGILSLVPTDTIKAGEPVFVKVTDPDQNRDPTVRDQVVAQLTVPSTGDMEWVTLNETTPNSGVFIGYIQSSQASNTVSANCNLDVVKNSSIQTTYTDAYNNTDTSESKVLVDPYGKVFSSFDGTPINGVTVTLINDDTGKPADVLGDGPDFAAFPNPVMTGGQVTDAAGNQYNFPVGEYRFPFVMPGHYHLQVTTLPGDYQFPSSAADADIQQLPGAPYTLGAGARGEQFILPLGPAIHIDIPLDRRNGMVFVTKQASKQTAAIGDFVQFKIAVQNRSINTLSRSSLADTLPKGFRYRKGSLEIDGKPAPDPQVAGDGRTMSIALPDIGDTTVTAAYVTEVTSGAAPGKATNTVTVVGPLVSSSNTATASVIVTDDLFKDKAILTGQVTLSKCGPDDPHARGLPGVRLFLEDGTNVTTDENGMWHIEGVTPGTHVVQLDVDSLPPRYEVSACNRNSRFAGTPWSQFVDVRGGTLWRADFKVQQKPDPASTIDLTQSLKLDGDRIDVAIKVDNDGPVDVRDADIIYNVPRGWRIAAGSETLDHKAISHSQTIVGSLWRIADLQGTRELEFVLVPVAPAMKKPTNRLFMMRPRFGVRIATLTAADRHDLDRVAGLIRQGHWKEMTIVGHTDDVRIAPVNRKQFKDNLALSRARAESVAAYLKGKVDVPVVNIVGVGDRYPIASNDTAAGRKQNRRVEILLKGARNTQPAGVTQAMLEGDSVARLGFKSVGTPKGMTGVNRLPLKQLAGGFDVISTSVKSRAIGSWDLVSDDAATPLPPRDPKVQGLVNMTDGDRLSRQISAVKLDLDSRLTPKLTLDGKVISSRRIGFKMEEADTGKTLYSYIGVDFGDPGVHKLRLQGLDSFGNVRFDQTARVVRVGDLYSIKVLDTGGNVADGNTPVKVKLALLDRAGEQINVPYKLVLQSDDLHRYDKNMSLSDLTKIADNDYVEVSGHGVLRFNPVNHSGVYHATLKYKNYRKDFQVFVEPEKRKWIMVGLAEGTAAYRTLAGNMQALKDAGKADHYDAGGRVAFYAKGQIKGQYILTAAYDTAKAKPDSLGQVIDPNAYYTLYGDRTATQYDAPSQSKLYLKLEKDQFYALFGDYSTGLSVTELSKYSRRFNGLKTEYEGDKIKVNAFAAEADQAFVKDEIRGDGTSGLYHLSSQGIVPSSETVTIETRDRFHSEEVLNKQQLQRYVDYSIDYDTGTIFFKEPIYSQDTGFNPVYIVANYEVKGNAHNRLNAGGRVAYKLKDNSEVGVTLVKEGVENRESQLAGADLHYQINPGTELKAEVATTHSNDGGTSTRGTAYLAEVTSQTSRLTGKAYVRQQGLGFGLGQQSASETGTRKVGAEAKYQVEDNVDVAGEAYRQTDLSAGTSQDVASTTMTWHGKHYRVNSGVRSARSDTGSGTQVSNQVTAGGDYRMMGGKLAVTSNVDAPIGGKNGAANFPKKLRIGLNYKLNNDITLKAEQEFTWGDDQNSQGTRVGMTSKLWKGAEVSQQVEQTHGENAQRLAAVTGLKQRWDVNPNLRLDFGMDRSKTIRNSAGASGAGTGMGVPPLTVTTVYSSPGSDDFTSVTFGSRFRKDAWDWSTRIEYRDAAMDSKVNLLSNVIHDLDEGKQLLAKVDIERSNTASADTTSTSIQLGYSYRPVNSRWTLLNKLDLTHATSQSAQFDTLTQKIVNNLNANYLINTTTQLALQYGMKYVVDNFDTTRYKGFTDLYGMELRHDMNDRWDIGAQGSFYDSRDSSTANHSYGISLGYNVAHNVWMSVGYNFTGFRDTDFTASEYTAKGVYLKYRIKFDQDSLRGARR